jgi:hypothetical protein
MQMQTCKNAIRTLCLAICILIPCKQNALAFFRHTKNTFGLKKRSYGELAFLAPRSITAENIYSLGIRSNDSFSGKVFEQMEKEKPGITKNTITANSQNIGLYFAYGVKTAGFYRYDFSFNYAQSRSILLTNPTQSFTVITNVNSSQTMSFDNIDLSIKYYSFMFTNYLDYDIDRFRFYVSAGTGLAALSGSLRGNRSLFGSAAGAANNAMQAISSDTASTQSNIRGIGLDGSLGTGVQIGFNQSIRFDIFFRRFFTIAKIISADNTVNGVTASQPARHSVNTIGLGLVAYFD